MFQLDLTEDDQIWLFDKYRGLSETQENGIKVVAGEFDFWASHEGVELRDTYQIRIEFQPSPVSDLPSVIETAGRTKKVAKERNIHINDLHTYEAGQAGQTDQACLCVKPDEESFFLNGFNFHDFIEHLIVPFFYAQRYFEKYDSWPWGAYNHGGFGWLEWYHDQDNHNLERTTKFIEDLSASQDWPVFSRELSKKSGVKGHHPCICQNGRFFRNCHKKVFQGLWELQKNIKEFRLGL